MVKYSFRWKKSRDESLSEKAYEIQQLDFCKFKETVRLLGKMYDIS